MGDDCTWLIVEFGFWGELVGGDYMGLGQENEQKWVKNRPENCVFGDAR